MKYVPAEKLVLPGVACGFCFAAAPALTGIESIPEEHSLVLPLSPLKLSAPGTKLAMPYITLNTMYMHQN